LPSLLQERAYGAHTGVAHCALVAVSVWQPVAQKVSKEKPVWSGRHASSAAPEQMVSPGLQAGGLHEAVVAVCVQP
jgi:hypothetical protein